MSAPRPWIAAVVLASWRWNSSWDSAPRLVGKPPPLPLPLKKLSRLKLATRKLPLGAGATALRGLLAVKLAPLLLCTR